MSAFDRLGIDPSALPADPNTGSRDQEQTSAAFAFKWQKRDTYETESFQERTRQWLRKRYCQDDPLLLTERLGNNRKIILDAGCGAGVSAILLFGDLLRDHDYLGVDISDAVEIARARFAEQDYPGCFLKWDITNLPIPDNSVDMIFSEGVLHHTDSVEKGIEALTGKLKQNGLFLFYVYAKKAVIREFTDDFVREAIRGLSDEEAWDALIPLTMLGKALGTIDKQITIPEDIPYLGIKKGTRSVQRFFYYDIMKAFYDPAADINEMNHINFDWFRPLNCHRHTPEEIASFCDRAGLLLDHMDVEPSGITVVARKR